ncbi:MAG: helix-turn-helix transcriptional regulator [Phycisphaerae bacterium]|nr:helix-turn-helix transcriptional regulator [Phycisphaerae bacterium]
MRKQSKKASRGDYVPIPLHPEFPLSPLNYTRRTNVSPIAPHVHDCFEIGYCHEGTGIFVIENKIFSFRPGDAVIINHREIHIMKSSRSDEVTVWNFLNLDPAALLSGHIGLHEKCLETESLCGASFENLIRSETSPEIGHTILEIINEIKEEPDGYRSRVRALVWSLMVQLHRRGGAASVEGPVPQRRKISRISSAVEHILENYSTPIEMTTLAGLCHMSVSNFRKVFHAAMGCSPQEYIRNIRLKAAASLLQNTTKPVIEIALTTGYPTLSNFNRQFQKTHGTCPRNWRKNHMHP